MKILAIESSCDETAAAIVESSADNRYVTLLSHVVATSMDLHAKTGGIIPEVAARNQIRFILPVINQALEKAGISFDRHTPPAIDALALTYGPGLIGSLLVGVETVKTLSSIWNKPLIPVNHLFGHIYANWIGLNSTKQNEGDLLQNLSKNENFDKGGKDSKPIDPPNSPLIPTFPLIALIVSGGHTDLLLMKSHTDSTWLGGTLDDAAGEAYDKTGRLLGLAYPAGPTIEKNAKLGNPAAFYFPRPMKYDKTYDFSFSGLKTAVQREVEFLQGKGGGKKGKEKPPLPLTLNALPLNDLCRGVQDAITDVLVYKTLKAAQEYNVSSIILGGRCRSQPNFNRLSQTSSSRPQTICQNFCSRKIFMYRQCRNDRRCSFF